MTCGATVFAYSKKIMSRKFDVLKDFISRPDSGHGKRISVVENRKSGYALIYGNAQHISKHLPHGPEADQAYKHRDWNWFDNNEAKAQNEPNPNARR